MTKTLNIKQAERIAATLNASRLYSDLTFTAGFEEDFPHLITISFSYCLDWKES